MDSQAVCVELSPIEDFFRCKGSDSKTQERDLAEDLLVENVLMCNKLLLSGGVEPAATARI